MQHRCAEAMGAIFQRLQSGGGMQGGAVKVETLRQRVQMVGAEVVRNGGSHAQRESCQRFISFEGAQSTCRPRAR